MKLQQEMTLWPCPRLTRRLLELPTVCDSDPLGGSPRPGTERLHFLDHFHSFRHAAKDNMVAIQPIWTKRRFIIAPYKLRQSMVHPSGFDSWLLVGWHHSCNDTFILGHHLNHPFFAALEPKHSKNPQLSPRILLLTEGEKIPLKQLFKNNLDTTKAM